MKNLISLPSPKGVPRRGVGFVFVLLACCLLPTAYLLGQGVKLTDTDSLTRYDKNYLLPAGQISAEGTRMDWKNIRLENLQKMINRDIIYPEMYTGTGIVTDWTAAITTALMMARDSGRTLIFTRPYTTANKISIDLADKDLFIDFAGGAKIITTAVVEVNDIEIQEAAIELLNGRDVLIKHAVIAATNNGSVNYLNGLLVKNCRNVFLEGVEVTGAPFGGVTVKQADYLAVENCKMNNNLYAGLIVENVKGGIITGGEYSYNGLTLPVNGYGITLYHRAGMAIDNEGFLISGVKAWYNKRKGIDVHGGVAGKVTGCHVKGFGNSGIYAVSEAGSDPDDPSVVDTLWLKHVKDWIIADNTIENDAAWYNAECTAAGVNNFSSGADACAIFIGSFGNGVPLSAGTFVVHDNLIRKCNVTYSRAHILIFTNWDGIYAPDAINIHDNTIIDAGINFPGDGVIHIGGINQPSLISIHNNQINGTSPLVFYTNVGSSVIFDNNNIVGSFSDIWDIGYDLPQKTSDNFYNGKPLPNLTARDAGYVDYSVTTSSSSVTYDIIKVDANEYDGCIVNCNITITTGAYNLAGVYNYAAYTGNVAGSIFTDAQAITRTGIISDPSLNQPSLSWINNGTNRTLRLTLSASYTGYQVSCKIAGWRLKIKGA
jgi:hypothetical protein